MKLAIVTKSGIVVTVLDDLEEYDLRKAIARADVCQQILRAMERAKEK